VTFSSNVQLCRLGEIATIERDAVTAAAIINGTTYVGLEHIDSDGQFVGVKGVSAGELTSNKFRFGPRHILFGKLRPYLKKTARPDFSGICSTDIVPILPGPNVDRDYLFHYLRHPKTVEQAVLRCAGANLPRLSPRDLANFEVPVPPLPDQRRIADILDKADAIRRKRKDAIALTEELLRSAFLDMFGDPVTNPKGWPRETLGNLLSLKSGNFLPAKQMESTGLFAVYGGNGINGRHSSYMFEEPVITIGRVGVYCGVVHRTKPRSWVTDNALYVATFSKALDITYLEYALRIANLNQYASQAAQPLISGGRLYPIQILVPPSEFQLRFARLMEAQVAAREAMRRAGEESERLFGSLVERAFSGELGTAEEVC
jgi:type I restriction enzyme, S subunit